MYPKIQHHILKAYTQFDPFFVQLRPSLHYTPQHARSSQTRPKEKHELLTWNFESRFVNEKLEVILLDSAVRDSTNDVT
jgi:hypothetical protein